MTPRTRQQARLSTKPELTDSQREFVQSFLLFQNENCLVFDKPPGLPTQARQAEAETLDRLLWAFARSNGKRPHLVHRLDAETSGVIVAARTKPMAAALSAAFEKRRVEKTYLAIVSGVKLASSTKAEGEISVPLVRYGAEPGLELMKPATKADRGLAARTHFRIRARVGRYAAVDLSPETGRMHQIRVHVASAGFPILGDLAYGGAPAIAGKPVPRTLLHARRLRFQVPDVNPAVFEAPLPQDFIDSAKRIGLELPEDWT